MYVGRGDGRLQQIGSDDRVDAGGARSHPEAFREEQQEIDVASLLYPAGGVSLGIKSIYSRYISVCI
jgi:hypothetical protein